MSERLSEGNAGGTHRYWQLALVSFIGWSLLAAIPTTSAYLGTGASELSVWWAMFKKIGVYYYMWGLLAPLIYRLTDSLPYRGRGLLITIPLHVAVMLTLSFALGFIAHFGEWQEWLIGRRAIGFHSMSAFTYLLIVLCCLSIKFYRLSLLRQREASQARVLAAELDSKLNLARVDSLRMQLNPHFLFNALNSVAALIDSQQLERAYAAIEQLGDLLRRALKLSESADVPLVDELRFTRAYLAMEQIRFGDRLTVEWQVDEDVEDVPVPAFILQPLVENAVKHAVSQSREPVSVSVLASKNGNQLELGVKDDGAVAGESEPGGLGLRNLSERLELRFGDQASVTSGRNASGYATTVRIPCLDEAPTPSK